MEGIIFLKCVFLVSAACAAAQDVPCWPRDYGNGGSVCVCNSTYCDTVSPVQKLDKSKFRMYVSSKDGLRFAHTIGNFSETAGQSDAVLTINQNVKFQSILGWGGAFHDSAGININSLSGNAKEHLMRSYFSSDGLEYSLCRVPIGGTDFSTHGYSYNDGPEDKNLTNFKLAKEDYLYKIPLIKKARNLTNGRLKLFASVWTAPKWMKTNGDYNGVGFLKKDMYQTWANYFVKFFDSYKDEGLGFWGVTTQNEPTLGFISNLIVKVNSVAWFNKQMSKWISEYFGPAIRNSQHASLKIMCLDDQRFYLPWHVQKLFENKVTKSYVDGIGYHWYFNPFTPVSSLTKVHDEFPDKFILSTEACEGAWPFTNHQLLGSWSRGENYFGDIIETTQNWVAGWIDWGIALDTQGGPTYINNFVDSPVIVNATADEFYKQPMFYAMGHFSKFVPPGSVRVCSEQSKSDLKMVAFLRPDNGTVIAVLNRNDTDATLKIVDKQRGEVKVLIAKHSFNTILYW